jgi:hypothetical protein
MFHIEHGIEVTGVARVKGEREPRYPVDKMRPGDSFFVEKQSDRINAMRVAKEIYGKVEGVKFTSRRVENGFRIWRLA